MFLTPPFVSKTGTLQLSFGLMNCILSFLTVTEMKNNVFVWILPEAGMHMWITLGQNCIFMFYESNPFTR